MRVRFWTFAAFIAVGLAANLALVSPRIARTAEEALRSRFALAASGLRAQLELLELRTSPRLAAMSPEVIEAARQPGDARGAPGRPEERALRAAAAALQPQPDLLVVAGAQGAAVSRRGRAASFAEPPSSLPVKAVLEGQAIPHFANIDGHPYRIAGARIPGTAVVVITGIALDDRLAAQIRTQVDGDVSFLQDGNVVASSLPADGRAALVQWAKAPAPGYGVLEVPLPYLEARLSGKVPLGASRFATRGELLTLAPGTQAALTLPAAPYFLWLARYQAFYLAALAIFVFVAFVWGLVAGRIPRGRAQPAAEAAERSQALVGTDVSSRSEAARGRPPPVPRAAGTGEALDPELPAAAAKAARQSATAEPELGPLQASPTADPIWSGDPFAPTPGQIAKASPEPIELPEEEKPSAGASELGAGWGEPAPGAATAPGGWGTADTAAEEAWPPPPTPAQVDALARSSGQKDVTLGDFSLTPSEKDPDEAHFRETFEKFLALRAQTGEPANLSYDKFAAKLRKNREELLARGAAKSVRFSVYLKDGRAAIKASALR